MSSTPRRALAASIVLPAVLLASACGSSTAPTTAPSASQSTSAAGSGVSPTDGATSASTSASTSGGTYTDKASLIAALEKSTLNAKTVHMTMDVAGGGQSLSFEGDTRIDPSDPATKLAMKVSGMDLQIIVVDKVVYLKGIPGQASPDKWALYDENSTIGKQFTASAGQADPTQMYDQFEKAVTDVLYVGPETVAGEPMQKYDLTIDTTKMPTMAAAAAGAVPNRLTYTIWLDASDRMRQVVFEVQGVQATMTMSKYGEPLDITAPPAAQVVKGTS